MDSRFKFVKSIDPKAVQFNIHNPKFGKLTLSTTRTVAVESKNVEMDTAQKTTQTITHTTTTTTTTKATKATTTAMPRDGRADGFNEKKLETIPSEHKPKILLYESTILHRTTIDKDPDASDLLTDDDTDSVRSSIDSNELEEGMKSVSKTQPSVINIESLDSQMQVLNVQSESQEDNDATKMQKTDLVNLSYQFKSLDISQAESKRRNQSTYSIQSLSSTDTFDRERTAVPNNSVQNIESPDLIVLSDTESDVSSDMPDEKSKRRISQEPPLKYTATTDNDCAAYNISSNEPHKMSSFAMQQVNQFFDNVPFTEACENSFNSTLSSRSLKDPVYISESTDNESSDDVSLQCDGIVVKESPKRPCEKTAVDDIPEKHLDHTDKAEEANKLEFSGNNIVFDIPVVKSSSDQPQQLIRSQSGIRLTAFNSSPIIKPSTAIATSASNFVLKKKGSSITVNSNNGQVEISAKININIHISTNEDSSSDASSDKNVPTNQPRLTQNSNPDETTNEYSKNVIHISGKENRSTPNRQLNSNAGTPKPNGTPKASKTPRPKDNENVQRTIKMRNESTEHNPGDLRLKSAEQEHLVTTPTRLPIIVDDSYVNDNRRSVKKRDLTKTPAKALPKTPSTASKLKEFEYVAPKSFTKSSSKSQILQNTVEKQNKNEHSTDETMDKDDSFEVDERIPITPKDQKLLHKVYGNSWKTPEVIRSYSAVKGGSNNINDRPAIKTPKSLRNTRESKGFNLFKRNHRLNLNSTLLEEGAEAEISIIEPPAKPVQSVDTCDKDTESAKLSAESAQKQQIIRSPSQSVINKVTSKPVETPSSATKRPKRNARKRILYSFDEDDDEGQTKKSNDDSFSSDIMTDDENDSDFSIKSNGTSRTATKKETRTNPKKKSDKNKLIYLDLTAEEVVEVDDNDDRRKICEEELVNMTKHFFEDDLDEKKEEIPKKKLGRKLFTPQYDDIEEISPEKTETVRRKIPPSTLIDTDIEIPRFTQTKLFDSKTFGSPSLNRTPDFKTPRSKPIIAPRSISKTIGKTDNKADLGTPPKTFATYTFLKSLDVCASMLLCHPDAKKFRENFKSNKEELTQILYKMFNDDVFGGKLELEIVWNKKLTTTAGRYIAKSSRKHETKSIIQLSDKVLTSADRLRCTLIHEMCHAATWIIDKDKRCHGPVWRGWANRANKIYPELPPIQVCHSYDIEYKYTYKCEMCENKSYSHSKSRKVENIRCNYCHGMIGIYLTKKQDGNVLLIPVRQATGFSKYVKEFYKEHKKPGVTHVEVMRTLSAEYAKLSDEEKKKY